MNELGATVDVIEDFTDTTFLNGTVSITSDSNTQSPAVRSSTIGSLISGDSGSGLEIEAGTPGAEPDGTLLTTVSVDFTVPVHAFGFDLVDVFDHLTTGSNDRLDIIADGVLVYSIEANGIVNGDTGSANIFDADGNLQGTFTIGNRLETFIGFTSVSAISQLEIQLSYQDSDPNSSNIDFLGLDNFHYTTFNFADIDNDLSLIHI